MFVNLKTVDRVGVLELNRSPANGLNPDLLEELENALSILDKKDFIRVIILSSNWRKVFSSGLDLRCLMANGSCELGKNVFQAVHLVYKIVQKIILSEKIFIAELPGPVIGSAASIALACDFRIGTDETWFWIPDPQYGGLLADGGLELLKNMVGLSRTKMLALTNDRVNAQKAYEWGILYKIEDNKNLHRVVLSEAERLCSYSSQTLSLTKKIVNEGILNSFRSKELQKILMDEEIYSRLQTYINYAGG